MTTTTMHPEAEAPGLSAPRVAGGFAAGALLSLAGGIVVAVIAVAQHGVLADEWVCSFGEYPASAPGGGKACFPYGEPVPSGWTADRLGNQRLGLGR